MNKRSPSLADIELVCHGCSAFDVNILSEDNIRPDFKNKVRQLNYNGGGMAANAAVAAARLNINTAFSGYISSDALGECQFLELEKEQVNLELVQRGDAPSPVCVVLAQADGRTTSFYKHHNVPSAPDFIHEGIIPKVVLFDGHQGETANMWLALAKKTGATTILDAGCCQPDIVRFSQRVDIVISAQAFAENYAGSNDPAVIAEKVSSLCDNFVVTLDRKGLLWNWKGQAGTMEAWPVRYVDGIGAGDAFHATFCAGLLQNLPFMDNLLRASAAGALCCSELGSREGLADLQKLEEFMKHTTAPVIRADIKPEQ